MPAWEGQATPVPAAHMPAKKKPPVVAIIIGLVVVVAAAGAYVFRDKLMPSSSATTTAAPVNRTASVAPVTTSGGTVAPTGTAVPVPGTVAPTSTAPAVDLSKVDEEVRKRLAAERARLDQLARQQQAAAQAPAATNRPPQPQPQVTQTVAPPAPAPVVPEPQPVAPEPQPVAPAPAPAPQPAVPQAARAQTGDMIEPGTPGLASPRMTRQALATYPAIARMQRIQGAVTINALVNENGQVVDTRVVSSANPILNDAAVQSVRRSTFSPGTKDGARVRSWTAVRVEFKL